MIRPLFVKVKLGQGTAIVHFSQGAIFPSYTLIRFAIIPVKQSLHFEIAMHNTAANPGAAGLFLCAAALEQSWS